MAARPTPKDDLLTATQTIFTALKDLEPELQQRVLSSVLSLLGISPRETTSGTPSAAEASRPPPTSSSRPLSPVELLQQKNPATNAQRIAIFAYYRDKSEGQSRFARADLKHLSQPLASPLQLSV
jgi:hypothetical protein